MAMEYPQYTTVSGAKADGFGHVLSAGAAILHGDERAGRDVL